MIEEGEIGVSGRTDRAGGWMLMHARPAARDGRVPIDEWLDGLGLESCGEGQIRFGGQSFDWMEGAAAAMLAAEMRRPPVRLVGLTGPPDAGDGVTVAMRWAGLGDADIMAVQRLSALVALVASPFPDAAIGWLPARIWSSAALFAEAVKAIERQGLPPVMNLIGFDVAAGGHMSVVTDGLAWFCGHELRLIAPSQYPAREATRRAARLAVDALVHHGLAGPMTVEGIDKGERLIIGPMADGIVPVTLRPPPG